MLCLTVYHTKLQLVFTGSFKVYTVGALKHFIILVSKDVYSLDTCVSAGFRTWVITLHVRKVAGSDMNPVLGPAGRINQIGNVCRMYRQSCQRNSR